MIKHLIIAIVILGSSINIKIINAQTFYPLPDSNAMWVIKDRNSSWVTMHHIRVFHYQDDTIINGLTYTKIYKGEPNAIAPQYVASFRSTQEGQTYFVPGIIFGKKEKSGEEYLLQDFAAQEGDTIFNVAFSKSTMGDLNKLYNLIVDSVRYVTSGPYSLRLLYLNDADNHYLPYFQVWIEKIGSISGGIFNIETGLDDYSLCCQNADDTIYFSTNYSFDSLFNPESIVYTSGQCELGIGVNEKQENTGLEITPNITSQYILLKGELPAQSKLSLYNISGELVYRESLHTNKESVTINISNLKPGLYLIIIQSNKQVWKQKILKH